MKRFWDKVEILGPDECWEWIASCNDDGYGQFCINGVVGRAHRFSYELHKGPIPEGMLILHSCHNPPCVNPYHLRLGTVQDNMDDKVNAGRQYKPSHVGNLNPTANLTENNVIRIRELLTTDLRQWQIAEMFRISREAVSNINTGRTWSHV